MKNKIYPFFEVNGTKYEIKRTRFLECEYERIAESNDFTDEEQADIAKAAKMQTEYAEIIEKFNEIKKDYFDDILDETKEKKYNAFKKLVDEKYNELAHYEISHKNTAYGKLEKIALDKGEKILIIALKEQYNVTEEEAKNIWSDYVDEIGVATASEWIMTMIKTLFSESEEDAFLTMARQKAEQKAEMRKGIAKMNR